MDGGRSFQRIWAKLPLVEKPIKPPFHYHAWLDGYWLLRYSSIISVLFSTIMTFPDPLLYLLKSWLFKKAVFGRPHSSVAVSCFKMSQNIFSKNSSNWFLAVTGLLYLNQNGNVTFQNLLNSKFQDFLWSNDGGPGEAWRVLLPSPKT